MWISLASLTMQGAAQGQCISMDFSTLSGVPASGYQAAAALPGGMWNAIAEQDPGGTVLLADTHGNPSGAVLELTNGGMNRTVQTCGVWNSTTPDFPLFKDGFRVDNGLEYKIFNLEEGTYEIYTYVFSMNTLIPGASVEVSGSTQGIIDMSDVICPTSGPNVQGVTFTLHEMTIDRSDGMTVNDDVHVIVQESSGFSGFGVMGVEIRRVSNRVSVGSSYCVAATNSLLAQALISATSSTLTPCASNPVPDIPSNDLELVASPIPAGQPGFFYYGPTQILVPFANGFRCVGGGTIGRVPAGVTNGMNELRAFLDFTMPVTAATQILPGSKWNIQAWYRDPAGGGAQSNLTNGLEIQF